MDLAYITECRNQSKDITLYTAAYMHGMYGIKRRFSLSRLYRGNELPHPYVEYGQPVYA
jgi:hypothetical protein